MADPFGGLFSDGEDPAAQSVAAGPPPLKKKKKDSGAVVEAGQDPFSGLFNDGFPGSGTAGPPAAPSDDPFGGLFDDPFSEDKAATPPRPAKKQSIPGVVINTAKDVGVGVSSAVLDVLPEYIARAVRKTGPSDDNTWLDRFIEEQQRDQARNQLSEEERSQRSILPIFSRGGVREGLSQLGNSIPSMILGLIGRGAGAALGGAAGSATGPGAIATAAAGSAIGGALGNIPMYRMKYDQVLEQYLDQARAENPGMSKEELLKLNPDIDQVAHKMALNEVVPEMVTGAVSMGLAGSWASKMGLPKAALRFAQSQIADTALEVAGETVTEKLDSRVSARFGLQDEPEITWGEALKRVWEPTVVMSLASFGLASAGSAIQNRVDFRTHKAVSINNMVNSSLPEDVIEKFSGARNWAEWNELSEELGPTITKKVVDTLKDATGNPADGLTDFNEREIKEARMFNTRAQEQIASLRQQIASEIDETLREGLTRQVDQLESQIAEVLENYPEAHDPADALNQAPGSAADQRNLDIIASATVDPAAAVADDQAHRQVIYDGQPFTVLRVPTGPGEIALFNEADGSRMIVQQDQVQPYEPPPAPAPASGRLPVGVVRPDDKALIEVMFPDDDSQALYTAGMRFEAKKTKATSVDPVLERLARSLGMKRAEALGAALDYKAVVDASVSTASPDQRIEAQPWSPSAAAVQPSGTRPVPENDQRIDEALKVNIAPADQSAQADQPNRSPAPMALSEQTFESVTPQEDVPVKGRWAVVDAASLVTSNDQRYDKALQPRDRDTKSSKEQITKIALAPDSRRLNDSPTTDLGAPLVDQFGQVISGNGRVMGLRMAYTSNRGEAYKAFVQKRAGELGVSTDGMTSPVLVRLVTDTGGQTMERIAELSNRSGILSRTTTEIAAADSKILAETSIMDLFSPSESGDVMAASNRDFLKAFVQATGDQSLRKSDGKYDREKMEPRIHRAVLMRLIGSTDSGRALVKTAIENAEVLRIRPQLMGLMRAGGKLLRLAKEKPQYALGDELTEGIQLMVEYRQDYVAGKTSNLDGWLAQQDMFKDDASLEGTIILRELAGRHSIGGVTSFFSEYVDRSEKVDTTTGVMFDDIQPSTKLELLREARDATAASGTADDAAREPRAEYRVNEPMTQEERAAAWETLRGKYKWFSHVIAKFKSYPPDIQDLLIRVANESVAPLPLSDEQMKQLDAVKKQHNKQLDKDEKKYAAIFDAYQARFAGEVRDQYIADVEAIAGEFASAFPLARGVPLKSRRRGIEKSVMDAARDNISVKAAIESLNDVLRSTIIVANPAELDAVAERVVQFFGVDPSKNRGKHKNRTGNNHINWYEDHLIQVPLSNGRFAEIQVMLPAMFVAKEFGPGHKYYEQHRELDSANKAGFVEDQVKNTIQQEIAEQSRVYYQIKAKQPYLVLAEDIMDSASSRDTLASSPNAPIDASQPLIRRGGSSIIPELVAMTKDLPESDAISRPLRSQNTAESEKSERISSGDLIGSPYNNSIPQARDVIKNNLADFADKTPAKYRDYLWKYARFAAGGRKGAAPKTLSRGVPVPNSVAARIRKGVDGVADLARNPADVAYLAAVEAGDMETAGRIVADAARRAGYTVGPVFHGTDSEFDTFSNDFYAENTGTGDFGEGFYFTSDRSAASYFGKNIMRVFLRADRSIDAGELSRDSDFQNIADDFMGFESTSEYLEQKGYDSITVSPASSGSRADEIVVFRPEQVKSAEPVVRDGDRIVLPSERFQPDNPSILREPAAGYQADLFSMDLVDEAQRIVNQPDRGTNERKGTGEAGPSAKKRSGYRIPGISDTRDSKGRGTSAKRDEKERGSAQPVGRGTKPDAPQSRAQSAAGNGLSGNRVSPRSAKVAGQRSPGNAGSDLFSWAGNFAVVPEAPRGDDSADRSPLGNARNLNLRSASSMAMSQGERRRYNEQTRAILEKLDKEKRLPTDAEREVLRRYTGEGGLSSGTREALNQHYTDYDTIRAMFRAIEEAGVPMRKVLEPAGGNGNFLGQRPDLQWTTVELDQTNHKVLSALYPDATHYGTSYEYFKDTGYDAAVSNVPFLEIRGGSGALRVRSDIKALHDFYFVHSLERVRDNGVIAFITATGTMDKKNTKIRQEIVDKADVIGAYRLPEGHFAKNAHTEVTTDVIFLQRRPEGAVPSAEQWAINEAWVSSVETSDGIQINGYYEMFPERMLGTREVGQDRLHGGKPMYVLKGPADLSQISISYKPYKVAGEASSKAKKTRNNLDTIFGGQKAPDNYKALRKWATKHGYHVRSRVTIYSQDGAGNQVANKQYHPDYHENMFITGDEVYRATDVIELTDLEGTAKVYKPLLSGTANKIIALNRISDLAAEYQRTGDEASAALAVRLIEQYRETHAIHPAEDSVFRKIVQESDASMYAEFVTLFDTDWVPADVFSKQTRYTDSGRAKVSADSPLKVRAFASENNRGEVPLGASGSFVNPKEWERLSDAGYAVIEVDSAGVRRMQNDILYYSGNVYAKIEAAESALRDVGRDDALRSRLERQIERLESIRPQAKTISEIQFKGIEPWLRPILESGGVMRVGTRKDEDTGRISFVYPDDDIVERWLNNFQLATRETDRDGVPTETEGQYLARVRDAEQHVKDHMSRIKDRIIQKPELLTRVEYEFNKRFRNYVRPNYSEARYLIDDVLTEMEAASGRSLRKNQVEWVIQSVYEGKGINAHDVGGGKTDAAILLAAVMKRRGMAQKPMLPVPAKVIHKWEKAIRRYFPDAKIVNLGKLAANTRKEKLFELANTNADFVLISHEGFEKIEIPKAEELRYLEDLLGEHLDDPEASGRQLGKLAERMATLRSIIENRERDSRLTLDKLGVDLLIVDEAHNYKNIGIRNDLVKFGIGTSFAVNTSERIVKGPDGKPLEVVDAKGNKTVKTEDVASLKSARSYDMRFKSRFITERNNGNNVFLLTATPTPNKPVEVFTMLKHLNNDIFGEYGIDSDKDFVRQFFDVGMARDPATGEGINVLRGIINAQELRGILNRYVDKLATEQMPWITPIPSENIVRHVMGQSNEYALIADDLKRREDDLKPAREIMAGDDTVIAIYSGGRTGSVDPRLYGGEHAQVKITSRSHNSEDDKLQRIIELVQKRHGEDKEAGQLIFLDNAGHTQAAKGILQENLHSEIKRELVESGAFTEKQVAIINGKEVTDVKTGRESGAGDRDAKKQAIVDAYTKGNVLVVIGTTTSMGEGMGLQKRTTDIYHADFPWTPGAIRQRNGRGIRFGNPYPHVSSHFFFMQGTFDSISYNLIASKKGWNDALWDKDVADYISTEEEMTGGAVPPREMILIEMETDPNRKAMMILGFRHNRLIEGVGQAGQIVGGIKGRRARQEKDLANYQTELRDREEKRKALVPNEKIQDDQKRAEAFETSKANLDRLIGVSRRRIEETESRIKELTGQLQVQEAELAVADQALRDFESQYVDQAGNVRPNVGEVDAVIQSYQEDLTGTASADSIVREDVERFLVEREVREPSAVDDLFADLKAIADREEQPYQLDLFSGMAVEDPRIDVNEALEKAFSRPEKAKHWTDLFAVRPEVASTIIPEIVAGERVGAVLSAAAGVVVKSPQDFAAMLLPLRSPLQESAKVAFLDKMNRIIEMRVIGIGSIDAAIISPAMVFANMPEGTESVMLSHNHPSGNPGPSSEDIRITRTMRDVADSIGVNLLDHVITNGESYYSFRESGLTELSEPVGIGAYEMGIGKLDERDVADWELVPRSELKSIRSPDDLAPIIKAMRQADAAHGHAILLTTKSSLTGVVRFPLSALKNGKAAAMVNKAALGHGAAAVLLDIPQPLSEARLSILRIGEELKTSGVDVLDAATSDHKSVREAGLMDFSFPARYKPAAAREDRAKEYVRRANESARMDRLASNLAEAREAAGAFVGQRLANEHTGIDAVVSNTTLGKMTSAKAVRKSSTGQDHALAVANVDKLFRYALLNESHQDKRGEPTIVAVHRFIAPMKTPDGRVLAVKLTVKETTNTKHGNPLYSLETLEIMEGPQLDRPESGIELATGQGRNTPLTEDLTDNVRRLLYTVKYQGAGESSNLIVDDDPANAEYLAAMERGDRETAQRLVDERAALYEAMGGRVFSTAEWSKRWGDRERPSSVKSFKRQLIAHMIDRAKADGWTWGYLPDSAAVKSSFPWVVYFDTPVGQISFHIGGSDSFLEMEPGYRASYNRHQIIEREYQSAKQSAMNAVSGRENEGLKVNKNWKLGDVMSGRVPKAVKWLPTADMRALASKVLSSDKAVRDSLDEMKAAYPSEHDRQRVKTDLRYNGKWDKSVNTQSDRLGKLFGTAITPEGVSASGGPTKGRAVDGSLSVIPQRGDGSENKSNLKGKELPVKSRDVATYEIQPDGTKRLIPLSERFDPNELSYLREPGGAYKTGKSRKTADEMEAEIEALRVELRHLAERLPAESKAAHAQAAKIIASKNELIRKLLEQRENVAETQRLLAAYMRHAKLPAGEQKAMIGRIIKTAKFKTPAGLKRHYLSAIEDIEQKAQYYAAQRSVSRVRELLRSAFPKIVRMYPQGKLTADAHKELKKIAEISNYSESRVDQELDRLGDEMEAYSDPEKSPTRPIEDVKHEQFLIWTFGNLDGQTPERAEKAAKALDDFVKLGRFEHQVKEEERKKRLEKLRETAIWVISGGKGTMGRAESHNRSQKSLARRIVSVIDAYDTGHLSFEMLLDKLSKFDKSSGYLGSELQYWSDLVHTATHEEQRMRGVAFSQVQEKLQSIYGVKGRRLAHVIGENTKVLTKTGVFKGGVELKLSRNQAYKLWQVFQDPTQMERLLRNGYSEQTVSELEQFMGSKVLEYARWQLDEFYPAYYEGVNRVYRELYYIDLPFNNRYSPIVAEYENAFDDDGKVLEGVARKPSSVLNGSLKMRKPQASSDIRIVDGDSLLMRHITQMEHFKSWGLLVRDMRGVFNNQDVSRTVRDYHGDFPTRTLKGFINDFARGGEDQVLVLGALDRVRSYFTRAVVASGVTLLKQLTSIPAALSYVSSTEFLAGFTEFLSNPMKHGKFLYENSDMLKNRYEHGYERDVMLQMRRGRPRHLAGAMNIGEAFTIFTRLGDMGAVLAAGHVVYRAAYKKALAGGTPESEARRIGIREMEKVTERTQQAGNVKDLGVWQRLGSFGKLFTMFMTAPIAYYRVWESSVLGLAYGRGKKTEHLRRLALTHVLLPVIFQYVADAFRFGTDDDDDEESIIPWLPKTQARALLMGPFNGLYLAGGTLNRFIASFQGERTFGTLASVLLPPADMLDDIDKASRRVGKSLRNDEITPEDLRSLLEDLAEAGGKAIGIPTGPMMRMGTGLYEAVTGQTEYPVRRALGYSRFMLGEDSLNRPSRPGSARAGRRIDPITRERQRRTRDARSR